jgi:ADP-ribosyltransferase exoenzyme/Fibronectin type III domain
MYQIATNKILKDLEHLKKGLFSSILVLLLSWCMTGSALAQSQQNAVDGTLQIITPHPIHLGNFAKVTNDKVKLTLTLNPAFWEYGNTTVKLRLMLEKGNSLMAQSPDIDVLTGVKSVVLVPGVPYTLTPDEIMTYFRFPALQGIDEATYSRAFTEGVYRLTFLVYAPTGKFKGIAPNQPISSAISQQFWIVDNEPPMLNVPHTGDNVTTKVAQPINFQWIPRAIQATTNTSYEFKIAEILPENAGNPYADFLGRTPLKTATFSSPFASFTPNQLKLVVGKTYAWRVRAKSMDFFNTEIVSYKNEGYSDIFTFRYSGTCDKPLGLKLEAKTSDLVATSWTQNPAYLSYRVAYRKYQSGQNWQWFEKETNSNYLNLTELQPNTEYEVTVGGLCAENFLSYSDTLRVKTLDVGQIKDVICGVLPPTDIANKNPLPSLAVGDVITAGDFAVNITRIVGGGGNFTGEGFIGVPWIGPKLKVKFNGITVNTDKKLINGFIETAYDPTFSNILSIDRAFNSNFILDLSIDAIIGTITIGNDPAQSDSSQGGSGTTTTGTSGQPQQVIIITDASGKIVQTLPLGSNYSIIDKNGNQYTISKDGKVTKLPPKVAMPINNSNGKTAGLNSDQPIASDVPVIIFEKADNTKYGFDAKAPKTAGTYEELPCEKCDDKKYYVAWKSVAAGDSDIVKARILINPNSTPTDSIFFQTEDGRAVYAQYEGNNIWRMYLLGTMNGEVKSIFAMAKTFKNGQRKTEICGKINVASYDLIKQKVILVPVKGYGANYDVAQLKTELNKIFKSAMIEYDVVKDNSNWQPSVYDPTKVMDLDHGLIYSYSPDQRAIIDAYKQDFGSAALNTLYLFLCNKSTEGVQGHTPLGKQYGFLFMGSNTITPRVVAHEIAHGAPCGLEHTFEDESTPKNSTDNLLDYGVGTDLIYAQWKDIHEFNFRFRIGQDETRGQHVEIQDISKIANFKNKNGTFTFMTPTGVPFTLPNDIKGVTFYANDEAKFGSTISRFYPDGALRGFILADKTEYFANYNSINVSEFAGYYEKGDKDKPVYTDKLTKSVERADQDFVIIGLPCVEFLKTSFKVKRVPYTANSWTQNDQTGRGQYLDKLPSSVNLYANVTTEEIAYSNPFREKATSFLMKNQSCADGFSKYIYKIASIIDRYEDIIDKCYPIAELEQRFARCTTCINNRSLNNEIDYQGVVNAFISEIQKFENIVLDIETKTTALSMKTYLADVIRNCQSPLSLLTVQQRIHVIKVLTTENLSASVCLTSDCSEKYILSIFEQTPESQWRLMLDEFKKEPTLLKKLFPRPTFTPDRDDLGVTYSKEGLTGEYSKKVALLIFEWMSKLRYNAPQSMDEMYLANRHFNYCEKGQFNGKYFVSKSEFSGNTENIVFKIASCYENKNFIGKVGFEQPVPWDQWVIFTPEKDYVGIQKGQTFVMPAIYAHALFTEIADSRALDGIKLAASIAGFVFSAGELSVAEGWFAKGVALADLSVASVDLTININEQGVKDALGEKFVTEKWPTFLKYYIPGRIIAPLGLTAAENVYNDLKAKNLAELQRKVNPEVYKLLNQMKTDLAKVFAKNIVQDWVITLRTNVSFASYFDDLANGTITRKFADILSIEEEAVLKFYTTNQGYKNFNQALRGEIPMTDFYIAQKNLMERALSKMPNSIYNNPSNLLYRIENLTELQIKNIYTEGSIINTKAFTSATYSENAIIDAIRSRKYTVLIRIEGKNGKLIEDLSTFPTEKEILFKTGTNFKVNKVGFSPNPDDYETTVKTIWLKEL